jgi:DNA transformation protein
VSLSELPNIGKNTERLLVEAGIKTPEQLRAIGATEALCRSRAWSWAE